MRVDLTPGDAAQLGQHAQVLLPREFGIQSAAELEQGRRASPAFERAFSGPQHSRQDLQQGALTGAVASNHPEALPGAHFEAHIGERRKKGGPAVRRPDQSRAPGGRGATTQTAQESGREQSGWLLGQGVDFTQVLRPQ